MGFSFFYTSIIFNPKETADNLKKYGGFVLGIRPGNNTADYFDTILTRLTVIGALYISLICILPEILISHYSVPFYLGGTSLLIVVNVVLDTITQVQTHLFSFQYENLIKKVKIRDQKK
jgi:preprotein translocase subunit SecY